MSSVLVIDGRTRKLVAFVASVTQAQADNPYQLVLRHALDMGHLPELLAPTEHSEYLGGGETVTKKSLRSEMPVVLMGEYSAKSSAGHVAVHSADGWDDGHRKVLTVGGLGKIFGGKGGLKVLTNPIQGTLVRGPVEIEEFAGAGNSNCSSANAAWAGVKLLAVTDKKSVFLVEGQSDYTYVVRLRSAATEAEVEFPPEHRAEMFSRENIAKRMLFSSAYRDIAYGRENGNMPSDEEVKARAISKLEYFFSAKGQPNAAEIHLGRNFTRLNHWAEVEKYLQKLLADLKNPPAPGEEQRIRKDPPADPDDEFVEVIKE